MPTEATLIASSPSVRPPTEIDISEKLDARPSLGSLFSRAVEEARAFAQAEVALLRAKVGERVADYKWVAIYLAAALVIGLSTVTALLVGLILTVATLVGPGLATLIVVLLALALAGLLAWLGIGHLGTKDSRR